MASQPRVVFHTDEDLALGEFGIQASLVRPPEAPTRSEPVPATAAPEPAGHGNTMIYSSSARLRGPLAGGPGPPPPAPRPAALGGRRLLVPSDGGTIGRSRDCAIVLEDAGVSRHHAELRPDDDGWIVEDLGSTNGVLLNGRRIRGAAGAAGRRPARARLDGGRLRTWMNSVEPVSVALKFGFLAVLYVFLLWVVRSARRDIASRSSSPAAPDPRSVPPDATGMYSASAPRRGTDRRACPAPGGRARPRSRRRHDLRPRLPAGGGPWRAGGDPDRRSVRVLPPRTHLRAGQLGRDRRPRLDQRHLPERGAARKPAAPAPGRPRAIGESEFSFEVD